MKYLKPYNKCSYCGSKKLKLSINQNIPKNFYLKAIQSDLEITEKDLKKIKVFKCLDCFTLQNNPWFNEETSKKIYSNIYGQHNRSWQNVINFFKKSKLPDHGNLFDLLNSKIKITNYAEYNSPFMGLFLNFFKTEYKNKNKFKKQLFENLIKYLKSRQVAGSSMKVIKNSLSKSKKYLKKIKNFKKNNLIYSKTRKFLFIDNSGLFWGQNDNYKSVNSKSLASELLDLNIFDLHNYNKKNKYDLFGIFHTLDHTFQPKKILNFALNQSEYVVVYCHVNVELEKQHLFSFTEDFLEYLEKQQIFNINLTNLIDKKYSVPEMYFLCSKRKQSILNIKKKLSR